MSGMKASQWRGPFLLALSLFVLGSFAYWLEFKQRPKKEEQEEENKKLFVLKDTPTQSIKVANGAQVVEFRCLDLAAKLCKPGENSKWELQSPGKFKGDDANINSLLSTLGNLRPADTIDLKEETPEKRAALLKDYGLDAGSRASDRRVELTTEKGTVTLFLGQNHPIGENIFALKAEGPAPGKVDENKVYLVPSYFKTNFEKDVTFWRDKKVLTLAAHEISAFDLEGSKGKISGQRTDGKWTLKVKGEEYPGDIENVEGFLNSVSYLTARDFAEKPVLKGAKPILKLSMQKQEAPASSPAPSPSSGGVASAAKTEPVLLTFFRKTKPDKLYATVSNLDPVFELEATAKDRLDKDLKDLRLTKLITSMERFTAKKLEFAGKPMGATPLVLTNTDGKWLTAEKAEVDAEKVQKFLDKLSGNRIKEFLTGKQVPTGEDAGLKVTLSDEKSEAKRQFLFWKNADKLYARDLSGRKGEVFLIDAALKDELPWERDFFKKK